jgi:hypothetical protein
MVYDLIPRRLYEHPIVEYIPLQVTTLSLGPFPPEIPHRTQAVKPALIALLSPTIWTETISAYGFTLPLLGTLPSVDTPLHERHDLTFLAVGFKVAAGIYRARKVSLVSSQVGPVYHLFLLPRKYFYKPSLDFAVYTSLGAVVAEAKSVNVGPRSQRSGGAG